MSRARNIKPGFFRNADIAELPFEARLLFIGLWTMADRAGRLEDRPRQIKMELFPADNLDCDVILTLLASIAVILRYEADGKKYIQVVNFPKHQNPHRDEKPSTIPAPCEHRASTVQALCKDDGDTVAIGLIPESLLLIPESLQKPLPAAPTSVEGFANFWQAWPKSQRKVAKDQCSAKWKSKGCEGIASQILDALESFKASDEWQRADGQFIPAPKVWLNESRWEAASALAVDSRTAGYI